MSLRYEELQQKVEESGLSQQSFVINAVRGAVIRPSDELAILKEISRTFSDYERQLRGLARTGNAADTTAASEFICTDQIVPEGE